MNRNGKGGFKTQMAPKAAYASMVTEIDRSVGKIISLMKEWGEWENTIFVFSLDNGVHIHRASILIGKQQNIEK